MDVEMKHDIQQQNKSPLHLLIKYKIEDIVDDINWVHIAFKCCAYTYICFIIWIAWALWPVNGHWQTEPDHRLPAVQSFNFNNFIGTGVCKSSDHPTIVSVTSHCRSKSKLLSSLSGGGRIGFDNPYHPRTCGLTYHPTAQICHILDRFSRVIFIGDDFLLPVYGALNTYLREDLSKGALKSDITDSHCTCGHQFDDPSCYQHFITHHTQVADQHQHTGQQKFTPYTCNRTPHSFLTVDASTSSQALTSQIHDLLSQTRSSSPKSIPLIISLSPTTFSLPTATRLLTSILDTLDNLPNSQIKTPILFVGPTAAGHIDIKGRKGNQEIWDFHHNIAKMQGEGVDVLGVWNLTVQASSFDGVRFGQEVAMVEAMMVVNWLAYLD